MPSTERPAGTSSLNAVRMIAFAGLVVVGAASTFGTPAHAQAPRYGTAVFRIKIPAPAKAASPLPAGSARPLYVSASTKSVAVLTDGKNRVVANADTRGHGYYVEVRFHPTVGTHIFTVTAYDRPGAQGNVLSLGTAPPVSVPASGNALVYLSLDAVVAGVTITLDQPHPILGSPAIIYLNVVAKDAGGNAIINTPGYTFPFASPITLTSSDSINGKLSQTSLKRSVRELPNDYERITVAYSGANVRKIVFSATGRGLRAASITPAVLIPLPPPKVAEQIITTGGLDPNAAFSTSNGQFLGTIGAPPFPDFTNSSFVGYDSVFVDDAARLAYIHDNGVEFVPPFGGATRYDIFQTSGARSLVDTFYPGIGVRSLAIDSRAKRIYALSQPIAIFSTTRGHVRLGKLPTGYSAQQSAIDSKAHRLYLSGCIYQFACGVYVISTIPPYPVLGSSSHVAAYDIAVDSAGGKLYLSDSSHINVYRTSDITRKVATIGDYGGKITGIAIDTWGRRLYVVIEGYQSYFPPYNSNVQVYDIDNGSLLGTIPILFNRSIAVAPYN